MRKSNKAKQTPSRTCADCFHFCACHLWAISISTDVAPRCPVFEPVRNRTLAELDDLRQMHKGDLAPVVHARWVHVGRMSLALPWTMRCSNCSCPSEYEHNFCPNCGRKMDGGENDDPNY